METNSLSINQPGGSSKGSTPMDSQILSSSMESTTICPYPKCATWWLTNSGDHRAIVGYSEGTICIVRLTINCPFIGTCFVERGNIEQLIVCRDNNSETITLMINTSMKEQWKLLLEQKSIGYTFPGEFTSMLSTLDQETVNDNTICKAEEAENWQFVLNLEGKEGTNSVGMAEPKPSTSTADTSGKQESEDSFEKITMDDTNFNIGDTNRNDGVNIPKTISAAKARLMSLRELGAKKIGTLKLKLAESRLKAKERGK